MRRWWREIKETCVIHHYEIVLSAPMNHDFPSEYKRKYVLPNDVKHITAPQRGKKINGYEIYSISSNLYHITSYVQRFLESLDKFFCSDGKNVLSSGVAKVTCWSQG